MIDLNCITVGDLQREGVKFTKVESSPGHYKQHFSHMLSGENIRQFHDTVFLVKFASNSLEDYRFDGLPYIELFDSETLFSELKPSDFKVRIYGEIDLADYNVNYVLANYQFKWQVGKPVDDIRKAWARVTKRLKVVNYNSISEMGVLSSFMECIVPECYNIVCGRTSLLFGSKFVGLPNKTNFIGVRQGMPQNGKYVIQLWKNFITFECAGTKFVVKIQDNSSGIKGAPPEVVLGILTEGVYHTVKVNVDKRG